MLQLLPVGTSCVTRNTVKMEAWGFLKTLLHFEGPSLENCTRGRRHRNLPLQDLLKFPVHTEKLLKSRKCKQSNTRNTFSFNPNSSVNQWGQIQTPCHCLIETVKHHLTFRVHLTFNICKHRASIKGDVHVHNRQDEALKPLVVTLLLPEATF